MEQRRARGLDDDDVRELVQAVAGSNGKLSARETDQLVKLVYENLDSFTASGKREMRALAGIHLDGPTVESNGDGAMSAIALRATLLVGAGSYASWVKALQREFQFSGPWGVNTLDASRVPRGELPRPIRAVFDRYFKNFDGTPEVFAREFEGRKTFSLTCHDGASGGTFVELFDWSGRKIPRRRSQAARAPSTPTPAARAFPSDPDPVVDAWLKRGYLSGNRFDLHPDALRIVVSQPQVDLGDRAAAVYNSCWAAQPPEVFRDPANGSLLFREYRWGADEGWYFNILNRQGDVLKSWAEL